MPFDFGGTFTVSQFERLKQYVRDQVELVDSRIAHLNAEKDRVGNLLFAFDSGGIPTAFQNDPPQTYCGKLFGAYEALGGDAEYDLQIRSESQPVYQLAGNETQTPQLMSNGEVVGVFGLSNADSTSLVQKIKSWTHEDLQRRKGKLERKIRRMVDYAEQLEQEIRTLMTLKLTAEVNGSLEYYLQEIDNLSNDRQYMAITDDSSSPDPHGKFARAPVAPYMPGPEGATSERYERTLDGLVKPQE